MIVPVKFRGKMASTGKYVYGTLAGKGILGDWLFSTEQGGWVVIQSGSLQRLAGYDKEGNEVYQNWNSKKLKEV